MNLKAYSLSFLISLLCMIPNLESKPAGTLTGKGHNGDITRILGLDVKNDKQRQLAQEVTDAFAQFIDSQDDANKLNNQIKVIAPAFSWGLYTHRIFFHWGFNGDPHRSKALNEKIHESNATANDVDRIWRLVLDIQAERNRGMMKAIRMAIAKKNGTCALTQDELNAVASLIYDIHILGDYVEGVPMALNALQDLDALTGDIITATRKLGSKDYKSLNAIRVELNKAKASGIPSQKAEKMLDVLETYIPQLIKASPRVCKALY